MTHQRLPPEPCRLFPRRLELGGRLICRRSQILRLQGATKGLLHLAQAFGSGSLPCLYPRGDEGIDEKTRRKKRRDAKKGKRRKNEGKGGKRREGGGGMEKERKLWRTKMGDDKYISKFDIKYKLGRP